MLTNLRSAGNAVCPSSPDSWCPGKPGHEATKRPMTTLSTPLPFVPSVGAKRQSRGINLVIYRSPLDSVSLRSRRAAYRRGMNARIPRSYLDSSLDRLGIRSIRTDSCVHSHVACPELVEVCSELSRRGLETNGELATCGRKDERDSRASFYSDSSGICRSAAIHAASAASQRAAGSIATAARCSG